MSVDDHRIPIAPIAGALAGTAVLGYTAPALAGALPGLRAPLGIEDHTASGRGYALTFVDGPHAQGTPAVLRALADAGATATFFLVGEQVERNPTLASEIVAAGHGVAVHCNRHRNLLRLTPRQVRDDIDRAQARIEDASGRHVSHDRPPYGVLNSCALRLARRRRWRTLLWSHWGRDWEAAATPETITARITDGVRDGAVLLLHDADDYAAEGSWRTTAAALPAILEVLAERGLEPQLP